MNLVSVQAPRLVSHCPHSCLPSSSSSGTWLCASRRELLVQAVKQLLVMEWEWERNMSKGRWRQQEQNDDGADGLSWQRPWRGAWIEWAAGINHPKPWHCTSLRGEAGSGADLMRCEEFFQPVWLDVQCSPPEGTAGAWPRRPACSQHCLA